jgi:hypothetical protein
MSSSKGVDWDVLNQLECPVCLEYMASTIKMCENGHNVCNSCRSRVLSCPTCKGRFIDVRNIALENIAAAIVYPCWNSQSGCTETFTLDGRTKHQLVCLYESRECPFRKLSDGDCSWTGALFDIAAHVRIEHDSETTEAEGHFKVKLLDVSKDRRYGQAVFILGELFYLAWDYEDNCVLSFAVFHFGHKSESEVFKYGIKTGSSDGYVAMCRKCHSYLEGGVTDWQLRNCVRLHYDTIRQYLSESGDLLCEIEIRKERLNGFVLEDMQENLPVFNAIYSEVSDETGDDWYN